MLDKLILGRYLQGDSWIHKLDPRTKLIGTFAFVLVIFLANNWVTYGLLIAYTLIALLLSKIPLGFFWKGIKPLIWVILFTVALQILFTSGGDVYFQWGFIQVTSEGIINAVFIFLRFVLIISFSTLLTLTTAPLQLTDAIEAVMRPLAVVKFPEPVCPIIAVYFPDGILKFTSNKARVSKGVFAWYAKFTSLKRMSITIPPTLLHQDTLQELPSLFREVLRLISLQTAHRVPFQQASYLI